MLKSSLLNLNLVIYSAWHKEFLDARNSRDGEKTNQKKILSNTIIHTSIER